MKIEFLGTGTSTGVPQIGCTCPTCLSTNPHDKRLRASAIITTPDQHLLIDAGPDLRTQLLTAGSPQLDALLITHSHYDHVGGIIDLRSYCYPGSFPVYCQKDVAADLRQYFPYCFVENLYPGVPTYDIHEIEAYKPFKIGETEILPVKIMHSKLAMLGYRIGDIAYVTDCKTMPEETIEALKGVDTLVINALRHKPHKSHLSLNETLQLVEKIAPRHTLLTHMSHGIGPEEELKLPRGVELSYDTMVVTTQG